MFAIKGEQLFVYFGGCGGLTGGRRHDWDGIRIAPKQAIQKNQDSVWSRRQQSIARSTHLYSFTAWLIRVNNVHPHGSPEASRRRRLLRTSLEFRDGGHA
jgi:hypothetical protein